MFSSLLERIVLDTRVDDGPAALNTYGDSLTWEKLLANCVNVLATLAPLNRTRTILPTFQSTFTWMLQLMRTELVHASIQGLCVYCDADLGPWLRLFP